MIEKNYTDYPEQGIKQNPANKAQGAIAGGDPWVNRTGGMRCKTCIWFVPKTTQLLGDVSEIGRCRRHAPTMGGYPVVYMTDWCGDHRLDENKV